jgi:LysM repeat protein
LFLPFASTKCARHRYVAIVLVPAAWLTACGGMRRGASVPETPSQLAPRSEPPVVSEPFAPPPPTAAVPTQPVTTPPITAPAPDSRDKQLEILTQAVIALHQEVARNDARSEKFLKENERLRGEVDSLLRDLDRSRDANQRVKKKLRALQEQLRAIAESPVLATADQRDGQDESAELSPPVRGNRAKQKSGSPPGGVAVGKPDRGRDLYHVVVAGETLFRIATAYGVDYRNVASENGIEDPAHIEVGQRIFISGATRVP